MAYSAPAHWAKGDIPTAALMNAYSDSIVALEAAIPAPLINAAQLWSYENVNPTAYDNSNYYFINRYRFLVYQGDSELIDPGGAEATMALSGDGTNLVFLDLQEILWIYPGKLYQVKDAIFALEARVGQVV